MGISSFNSNISSVGFSYKAGKASNNIEKLNVNTKDAPKFQYDNGGQKKESINLSAVTTNSSKTNYNKSESVASKTSNVNEETGMKKVDSVEIGLPKSSGTEENKVKATSDNFDLKYKDAYKGYMDKKASLEKQLAEIDREHPNLMKEIVEEGEKLPSNYTSDMYNSSPYKPEYKPDKKYKDLIELQKRKDEITAEIDRLNANMDQAVEQAIKEDIDNYNSEIDPLIKIVKAGNAYKAYLALQEKRLPVSKGDLYKEEAIQSSYDPLEKFFYQLISDEGFRVGNVRTDEYDKVLEEYGVSETDIEEAINFVANLEFSKMQNELLKNAIKYDLYTENDSSFKKYEKLKLVDIKDRIAHLDDYVYMTDDQRAKYLYFLDTRGEEFANQYYSDISELIKQQKAIAAGDEFLALLDTEDVLDENGNPVFD